MLQSKKNLVAGIFMGVIGVLIVAAAIGSIVDENSEDTKKESQTFEEFKSKYMDEQEVKNDQNFVDTTGYAPEWAKDIGENQASMKCANILLQGEIDSLDSKWCMEFQGFLQDKQN